MARLQPRLIWVHHMAVGAGLGIVGQVGIAFGVEEGVSSQADHTAAPQEAVPL